MKQVIAKSILFTTAFVCFLCQQSNAQLGVGTTNPNGLLDVTSSAPATPANNDGFLAPRVSAFPATNPGANQNGMLIYLTATVNGNAPGFYYWDNAVTSWKKFVTGSTASATSPSGLATPLVSTTGGTSLIFGLGGWSENTLTTLSLTEVSDLSNIDNTGVVTIAQPGLYFISAVTTLSNTPSSGAFDGTFGVFQAQLQVQPNGVVGFSSVNQAQVNVFRGPDTTYPLNNTVFLNLQTGDQVRVQFSTTNSNSMTSNTLNLLISKTASSFKLFKF